MVRTLFLVVAVLVVGFLVGRWTAGPAPQPAPDVGVAGTDRAQPPDAMADARLSGTRPAARPRPEAPPRAPTASAPAPPPTPAAAAPDAGAALAEGPLDPLAACRLEVRIEAPLGSVGSGYLYALPAGSPGVDGIEEVPHAWVETTEKSFAVQVLPLPAVGTWDVGFVCGGGVHALSEGVAAVAGARIPVRLVLPAQASITVRYADAAAAEWARGWRVSLRIWDEEGGVHVYPGRSERPRVREAPTLFEDRDGVSGSLPVGRSYRVTVHQVASAQGAGDDGSSARRPGSEWSLAADRTRARAGDMVLVRLVENATLHLRVVLAGPPPPSWKAGVTHDVAIEAWAGDPTVGIEGDGLPHGKRKWWSVGLSTDMPHVRPEVLETPWPPSIVGVSWSGPACRPGRLTGIELRPGETMTRDVVLEPTDPAPAASEGEELPLLVVRVAGDASASGGPLRLLVWAAEVDPETGDGPVQDELEVDPREGRAEVGKPGLVTAARLAATWGMDRAAQPAVVDGVRREVVLVFEPAGHLMVVPSRFVDPRLGQQRLRRTDRLPLPVQDWDLQEEEPDTPRVVNVAPATPGVLLGPLPAGTYRFDVLLGRTVVGHVTGTVVPGRLGVLRLP